VNLVHFHVFTKLAADVALLRDKRWTQAAHPDALRILQTCFGALAPNTNLLSLSCLVHLPPAPCPTTHTPRRKAKNHQSLDCAESVLSSFPAEQVPQVSSPKFVSNDVALETSQWATVGNALSHR